MCGLALENCNRESMARYHRIEAGTKRSQSPDVALKQLHTQEIWGQSSYYTGTAAVKAKPGPLPEGANGVEFETDVPPTAGTSTDAESYWYHDQPDVTLDPTETFAKLKVKITRVRYTTGSILRQGMTWEP